MPLNKNLREKLNFSQEELAKVIGVTQSAVAKWETGETMPRASLLPKLAEVLQCSIDDLYASDATQEGV